MTDGEVNTERELNKAWSFIVSGKPEIGYEVLKKPTERAPHFANRAIALLLMNRREEALTDYRRASELSDNASSRINTGVVLWWLKRRQEAVEIWLQALDSKYKDAAGGVQAPAFLFFAASKLSDLDLEKKAMALLRNKIKSSLNANWPGPIAGYLLGDIDEKTLFDRSIAPQPILQARHVCQAYFWNALIFYRDGKLVEYLRRLNKSTAKDTIEHRSVILESEYWLACAEIECAASEGLPTS